MFQKRAKIWLNIPKNGKIEAELPKYHISTARAKRSGASAWAWAHALSMVTWHHQNIVSGYHLIMFTHLFKPLLVRVWIPKKKIPKREKMCPKLDRNVPNIANLTNLPLQTKKIPNSNRKNNNRKNINWLWILKMGWFWNFISFRSIPS